MSEDGSKNESKTRAPKTRAPRAPEHWRSEIMRYIEFFISAHGKAPTVREIGRGVGLKSTNHVQYYLNWLEKEGYITRKRIYAKNPPTDNNQGRGLYLTNKRMFN